MDPAEETTLESSVVWPVFGDLMACLFGLFVLFFVFEKVAKPLGLCEALFGVPTLGAGTPLGNIDPLIFAVPVSLLFAVVVSLFTPKLDDDHLAACFPD